MTARSALATVAISFTLGMQARVEPARFERGDVPPLPVLAVGGGQVILQLEVGADGRVVSTRPLRTTSPFAELVVEAVKGWRFVPARQTVESGRPGQPPSRLPVPSDVLLVCLFRPPTLFAPAPGEVPRDVTAAPASLPFPIEMANPGQSPLAYNPGVVLLEAHVSHEGSVTGAGVIRSAPPYDDAAVNAVRQWRFRPARVNGQAVAAVVYAIVGFPTPVSGS